MAASKLNWGIIGTGNIAHQFAKGVIRSNSGHLAGVASRSLASAEKFVKEDFLAGHTVKPYGSYEAMLADPTIQAVYVSTPHPLHPEWTLKAIAAGKHVLCEKPITLNSGQAQTLAEAARHKGVLLMEAYMYRCHPQVAKLVELIKTGAIGEVRSIQCSFSFHWPKPFNTTSRLTNHSLGGGGILDVGGYCTTACGLIAGATLGQSYAEPVSIQGAGKIGKESRVDEYASAVLKYDRDIIAVISSGVQVNMENKLRIYGSEGRISVHRPWVPGEKDSLISVYRAGKPDPEQIAVAADRPLYALEADAFAEALAADRRDPAYPAMSIADTLANMRVLDKWRESIGLQYDEEIAGQIPVVGGRKLETRSDALMTYGQVAGVEKPVSRLIFGIDKWSLRTAAHASALFDDYFERGGNTWDTAYIYGGGASDKLIGHWHTSRGVRDKIVILGKGAHTPFCTPEGIIKQLDESLERMKTDYIDIYMMHRDNPDVPVSEFVDVLNRLKKEGKIHAFGGSNWSIDRTEAFNTCAAGKGLTGMCGLSNNFSLAQMVQAPWGGCVASSEPTLKAWHEKTQTPVFSWSSQARGFFVRGDKLFTQDAELVRCWYSEENFQRQARAKELAAKYGVSPIQIALAYVLCQAFPTFALIGPFAIDETRSSFDALKIKLTPHEVKWLNLEA